MSELGLALREAREEMDLSLEDVQEKTKIQKRYLQAIEDGEFNRLPGQFYTRAFIKSYAEAVGLDSNEVFETYHSEIPRTGTEIEALPPRNTRETSMRPSTSFSFALTKNVRYGAMVVVILALAIGVWVLAQALVSGKDSTVNQNQSDNSGYTKSKDIGSGTKRPSSGTSQSQKSPSNTNSTTKSTDKGTSTNTSSPKPAKSQQKVALTKTQGSYFTYTVTGAPKFVLDVSANKGKYSWIEIYANNASGTRYYYGNVSNTTKNVSFHKDLSSLGQVYIKVGNALNTTITVNGEAVSLQKNPIVQHITLVNKK